MSAKHLIVITNDTENLLFDKDSVKELTNGFNAIIIHCYDPDGRKHKVEIFDNPELRPIDADNFLAVISKLNLKKPRIIPID